MAGNGRNDTTRSHGVAVPFQILDHGHLRVLEVGQNHAPLHLETRYGRGCALDAREHALWVDAPLARFVPSAAPPLWPARVQRGQGSPHTYLPRLATRPLVRCLQEYGSQPPAR